MMKEKRDISPVLLKIGIISAFSLIGIFYSVFKSRRINRLSGSSSSKAEFSLEYQSNQIDSGKAKDESGISSDAFDFENSDLIAPAEDESPSCSRICVDDYTNTSNENVYLLPEFNELVEEHDSVTDTCNATTVDHEVEIMGLRSTIKTLNERIRSLELKLLEFHGYKEQESYVTELQNRVKINHMESKILHLKINALMAYKKRLEEQVSDSSKLASELEIAKSKIKMLENELIKEGKQNKGYLLAIQQRVARMQDEELKVALSNSEVQFMLERTKDLTEEIEELKKSNRILEDENSALSHKVEYLQNFATSVLEDEQAEALKKDNLNLKQQNEDLSLQIERLEAAHCTDVEELVYLRWINACLRYELRNHVPATGKTIARDLSRSLSPKSEEKAKQLILEYAQKEKSIISIADFDLEQWSTSHSYLTDSDEEGYDDNSSLDLSSTNYSDIARNSKIFGKLMRLLRGKDGQNQNQNQNQNRRQSSSSCIDSKVGRSSSDIRSRTSPKGEKSHYVERNQRNSHDGSSCIYRVSGHTNDLHEEDELNRHQEDGSKIELAKYAEALKGSSSHQKTPVRRRAASCSTFKHW